MRQLDPGSGEEQPTVTIRDFHQLDRSESRRPIKRAGSGQNAYVLRSVRRRNECIRAEPDCEAEPIVTQFGRRLTYAPPLTLEKGGKIKHHLPFQHIVDRPS
jgi:hypothetical protein